MPSHRDYSVFLEKQNRLSWKYNDGRGRLEAAIWEMAAMRMKDDRLKERNKKGGR